MIRQTLHVRRRGVHGIVAISLLIGMTIAVSSMLFVVLVDYTDIIMYDSGCMISDYTIYGIGTNSTYFMMHLSNYGSSTITAANVTFIDDHFAEYGFRNSTLEIEPDDTWIQWGTFQASVSDDTRYPARASALTDDGSIITC